MVDPVERVRLRAREDGSEFEREDSLAVEEPLEIRLHAPGAPGNTRFVTTMRTPGHDEELVAGLLFAEGILRKRADLLALEHLADPRVEADLRANVLVAELAPAALARAEGLQRATIMGSACGVCGRTEIGRVLPEGTPPIESALRVGAELLLALPERLRMRQSVFAATGGLHAAGLFDQRGALLELREDIGRHNAVDKLIGTYWLAGKLPLSSNLLLVSGRAGFELVQKASFAGIPLMASVSAPSSLAVELAEAAGITLVGFLRERRFNVYTHAARVAG
ncbi:MAG: formate dehydrogenase accessory sulfurtransferase FdhD [Planctomycetes bacterium]|nr:formate dehydrogenase accessory sulfurtransferase FdhD [Planctomycetota bacterium]